MISFVCGGASSKRQVGCLHHGHFAQGDRFLLFNVKDHLSKARRSTIARMAIHCFEQNHRPGSSMMSRTTCKKNHQQFPMKLSQFPVTKRVSTQINSCNRQERGNAMAPKLWRFLLPLVCVSRPHRGPTWSSKKRGFIHMGSFTSIKISPSFDPYLHILYPDRIAKCKNPCFLVVHIP